MNTDFETLWVSKHEEHCPLTDEQMDSMIARAMKEPASMEPVKFKPRHTRRWLIPVGAVAAVAAMVITVSLHHHATPKQVEYNGQSVKFISNNNCSAENVIDALNLYIEKL